MSDLISVCLIQIINRQLNLFYCMKFDSLETRPFFIPSNSQRCRGKGLETRGLAVELKTGSKLMLHLLANFLCGMFSFNIGKLVSIHADGRMPRERTAEGLESNCIVFG